MPTTLFNIRKSHPLIKWDEVAKKLGVTDGQLSSLSLTGLHDEAEKREALAALLRQYVFVKQRKHIRPIVADDFYGEIADVFRENDTFVDYEDEEPKQRFNLKREAFGKAKYELYGRLNRWRRSIVSLLVEAELLDREDIGRSVIVEKHGFSAVRLEALLKDNGDKSSQEIKDDLYLILLLCQFLDVDIEFG